MDDKKHTSPDRSTADVLVLAAHPAMGTSRVNRMLMHAAARVGRRVEVRDLYALYPDYLIDIGAEQACLEAARLVVWQHPIHWYGAPPLMKLWMDEVLAFGWAYGPGGRSLLGKDLWLVASTGDAEASYRPDSYNRYFFDAFLPPYEQAAVLCGMRFLPPLLLHDAQGVTETLLASHAEIYARRLASYPGWPELEDLPACAQCDVPVAARPPAHERAG